MKIRRIIILIIISYINLIYAKEIKLKIIDKDIKIPLEGVTIKINDEDYFSDEQGNVIIKVDDSIEKITAYLSLIGYELKKIRIDEFDREILIEMNISGIIEGEELVIEEKYYKKEDKIGTSFVIDKEELNILAMRDRVEDVYNGIKTMPGVSYTSNFHTTLSIRGGDGDEVSASYDGFIIRYPYYWGRSYTLFDPNIVEFAKFNNGVFDVKYGTALSGLIEVNTKVPDEGFKFAGKLGLSAFSAYTQIPFGKKRKSGLLVGGRVTYLDIIMGPIWRAQGSNVERTPYIYDCHLKWFFQPDEKFKFYIQGYYGADGISMDRLSAEISGIDMKHFISNKNYHAIGFSKFEITPIESIFINILTGYEFQRRQNSRLTDEHGTKDYSDDFKSSSYYNPAFGDSFDVSLDGSYENLSILNSGQSQIDFDIKLHEKVCLSFGVGLIYDVIKNYQENQYFHFGQKQDIRDIEDTGYSNQFNSNLYLNLNFYPLPEKLKIELGCRIDHFAAFYNENSMNTYPAINPRFYIAYTPIRNKLIEYLTLSLGVGLYSKIPSYRYQIEYPINDYTIAQQKALNNVLGLEVMFPHGFKVKLEAYYKYYFHRYYVNYEIENNGDRKFIHYSDGIGHATGFDIILKRKISRYIDGWISYSFIFARYFNPCTDDLDFSLNGNPVGIWYYPNYHRWHGMNIILNIKPTNWLTISPSFGIHSGLPKILYGDAEMYGTQKDGEMLELYRREEEYSDTERTGVSFPFSLKIDIHHYFPKRRIGFEIYVALDNISALFYTYNENIDNPDQTYIVNQYTGEIIKEEPLAYTTFMPSFGIKISY